jgi:hypothetical protein
MEVINGKWSRNKYGDSLTIEDNEEFTDRLMRVKEFARGRELTHSKVQVLFRILDTDDLIDGALHKVLGMTRLQISQLF